MQMDLRSKCPSTIEDRISEVPDAVLCHILSFLKTKIVVRTSILSTRWKNLWAFVSNLDFDDEDFADSVGFWIFVDRVLLCRDSATDIEKFRLHCYCYEENSRYIDSWIRIAIQRNVVELDLFICTDEDEYDPCELQLPKCVFTCKTLVVLKVASSCIITYVPPTSGCFPNLKFLYVSVDYIDKDSMEKLFSCCPVLEDLTINGTIASHEIWNINISVPQLKTLSITLIDQSIDDHAYNLHINAPKLENLYLDEDLVLDCSLENVKSLVKADIFHRASYEEEPDFTNSVIALMAQISSVKYLSLSAHDFEACRLPTFVNLNQLKLVLHDRYNWQLLTVLLERSPNLQDLFLHDATGLYCHEEDWNPPESVPTCFLHLKTISIWRFQGCQVQMKIAKYLLKNARILNDMKIYTCVQYTEQNKLCKELLMFHRGSATCQVEFINMCF